MCLLLGASRHFGFATFAQVKLWNKNCNLHVRQNHLAFACVLHYMMDDSSGFMPSGVVLLSWVSVVRLIYCARNWKMFACSRNDLPAGTYPGRLTTSVQLSCLLEADFFPHWEPFDKQPGSERFHRSHPSSSPYLQGWGSGPPVRLVLHPGIEAGSDAWGMRFIQ